VQTGDRAGPGLCAPCSTIDIIKARLIRYFGYNEVSATDVLNYVASIFARGNAKS
jgi:hypothetical protein